MACQGRGGWRRIKGWRKGRMGSGLDPLDEEDVPMPQEIEEISLTFKVLLCLFYVRGREIMLVLCGSYIFYLMF